MGDSTSPLSKVRRFGIDIVAGSVGGLGICLVGHPFDTLKVRLQTQSATNPRYAGLADCFRKTLAEEGMRGLYKGVEYPLIAQGFFRAVMFSTHGLTTSLCVRDHGGNISQYFLSGALTGAIITVVESPIDFFKTQMQVQVLRAGGGQYKDIVECTKDVIGQRGVMGAYQGAQATLIRNIPAAGMYFATYEVCKRQFSNWTDTPAKDLPGLYSMLSGSIAGIMYWGSTYPLDAIKSALMGDALAPSERRHKSYMHCVRQMYAEGGAARFFRGLAPCMLRSVPANGTMFYLVEMTRSAMSYNPPS